MEPNALHAMSRECRVFKICAFSTNQHVFLKLVVGRTVPISFYKMQFFQQHCQEPWKHPAIVPLQKVPNPVATLYHCVR